MCLYRAPIETDLNSRATGFDLLHKASITRFFEKNIMMAKAIRSFTTKRGVGFANPSAQMRREMQNLHSAAIGLGSLMPPGATTAGLTTTFSRNRFKSISRWSSMLSGRQWVS
ncbi:hypothetical protein D3C87_1551730 [compost metagenome]